MTSNPEPLNFQKIVKPYCQVDDKKSWGQVFNTLTPLLFFYVAAFLSYSTSPWLTALFGVFAGFFTVRTFIIMHDCGHGSFIKKRSTRDRVGTLTGILTFTPYFQWTREHAAHHQHSGNLDYRGRGDIWTMTLEEYRNSSSLKRFGYWLYRHPLVTFGIGPVYLFQFRHRITLKTDRKIEKNNVYFTNLVLLVVVSTLIWLTSWQQVLLILGLSIGTAQAIGCLLFYVQHQYEEVYWKKGKAWDYNTAALEGCSFLKLPKVFQWFSGNIGYHHIHHLNHKVPNYNLQQCHEENGVFHNVATLTMKDIIRCMNLKIYDESTMRLLDWKEVKQAL